MKIEYIKGKDNKLADFLSRINSETNEINNLQNETENLSFDLDRTFNKHRSEIQHETEVNNEQNPFETENLSFPLYKVNNEEINAAEIESDNATIHSQEENFDDHIPILETVVNRFRKQIILTETKEKESEKVFNYRRIYIKKQDLEDGSVNDILRRYINKGKVGIYYELDDHEYNKLQRVVINLFPTNSNIKFVKCKTLAIDIEDKEQLNKQISLYHKNEVGHSGIIATYEGIKNKIYNPEHRTTVHRIINNCDICSSGKYDRNPIKKKFHLTETPTTISEIIHVDTYVNSKHSFINFIDKFSKHVVSLYLEDRNTQKIIEKLRQYLAIKGKPKKFVFDN